MVRYNSIVPFTEIAPLGTRMDRVFEGLFDSLAQPAGARVARPALDLRETAEAYLLEAELPGVRAEDLELEVSGDELTISAKRAETSESAEQIWHRRERRVTTYQRRLRLPEGVDGTAVEAELKDGVLTVKLPKSPERRPRRIDVRGSQAS
jgi:HSP20 family protein